MTTTDRPIRARRRLRLAAVTIATLVAALSACGDSEATGTASASTTATTVVPRPTASFDGSVRIDHGQMHIRCVGHGPTTVLLIAGWGDAGDNWTTIEPAISERARVCSYARFGTGTSDPPSVTQTFATQAADLRALLERAGEPGPYVVVGHSFGGAQAVTFAHEYAAQVSGLLLLDTSPVTWPSDVCAVGDDGGEGAANLQSLCRVMRDPTRDPERLDVVTAFDEVATIASLGDTPMTVMTNARWSLPGLAAAELTRLRAAWNDGAERWAALSSASETVPVEDTSHYIQLDHPDLVVDELLALLPTQS
jgi:pimeloyl-ACP methyl ester carboxylesterase